MIVGKITAKPNFALIISALKNAPAAVMDAAGRALDWGLQGAVGIAMKEYLSGPRPARLGVRSGRLRGSLTRKVTVTAEKVTGILGSNVPYAAFHEFGFNGQVQVKAHARVVKQTFIGAKGTLENWDGRRAWREQATAAGERGAFIGWKDSRAAAGRRAGAHGTVLNFTQQVRAHTRNISYSGKPYARPAIAEMLPAIRERAGKLIVEALKLPSA